MVKRVWAHLYNYSFDAMELNDDLLRGIFAYGFEKPSAIQQRGTMPLIQVCAAAWHVLVDYLSSLHF